MNWVLTYSTACSSNLFSKAFYTLLFQDVCLLINYVYCQQTIRKRQNTYIEYTSWNYFSRNILHTGRSLVFKCSLALISCQLKCYMGSLLYVSNLSKCSTRLIWCPFCLTQECAPCKQSDIGKTDFADFDAVLMTSLEVLDFMTQTHIKL